MIILIYILYTIVTSSAGIMIKYNNTFFVYPEPIIKFYLLRNHECIAHFWKIMTFFATQQLIDFQPRS